MLKIETDGFLSLRTVAWDHSEALGDKQSLNAFFILKLHVQGTNFLNLCVLLEKVLPKITEETHHETTYHDILVSLFSFVQQYDGLHVQCKKVLN